MSLSGSPERIMLVASYAQLTGGRSSSPWRSGSWLAARAFAISLTNLSAQARCLYHTGCRRVSRSTLARVNERQPYTLYEALFAKLYTRCQTLAPRHRFRFKNKLYSLDASLIDLSLSVFPWADYNRQKAAMKLHMVLDHDGYLPAFATITHAKTSDLEAARTLNLPRHSIVVCDRGYIDYAWFHSLTKRCLFFVTRALKDMDAQAIERHAVPKASGVTLDETIQLNGKKPRALGVKPLRRVGYRDPETSKEYVFLTNIHHLAARTIAALYKERWQIELFFKWLKQNLKIKSLIGTSRNAVLTQIWAALCMCLLLVYLKLIAKLGWSLQQMLRLLQLNLFLRRDLVELLRGDPPPRSSPSNPQLVLM